MHIPDITPTITLESIDAPASIENPDQPICPADSNTVIELDTPAVPAIIDPAPTRSVDADEHPTASLASHAGRSLPARIGPESFPHKPRANSTQIPTTIENVMHLLDAAGITIQYDVITKDLMLSDAAGQAVGIDDVISLANLNGLATGLVANFVVTIGMRNKRNPVEAWIRSKPWDGEDRIAAICQTVTAQEGYPTDLKDKLVYRWLLSAVAAAIMPSGFKARGVLTFQGRQGLGKTSWGMALISDRNLRRIALKVDHHLDGGNKDSILGAISHWIVEIGELDSSFRKDIARLKGFLTSDCDKLRPPYGRTAIEFPRRTVFFATVNDRNFLVDPTGNSRFWTIPVERLDYMHEIDMQQVYAQLVIDVEGGEQHWLTESEDSLLAAQNLQHQAVSVIRERMLDAFDTALIGDPKNPAKTPMQVLVTLGMSSPTNAQCRECGTLLRELLGEPSRINGREKWRIPLPRDFTSVPKDNEDEF